MLATPLGSDMNTEVDVMKLSYYVREIRGYRSGHLEDWVCCLVGCDTLYLIRELPELFSFIPVGYFTLSKFYFCLLS